MNTYGSDLIHLREMAPLSEKRVAAWNCLVQINQFGSQGRMADAKRA